MQTFLEIFAYFHIRIRDDVTLYLSIVSLASQMPIHITALAISLEIHYLNSSC